MAQARRPPVLREVLQAVRRNEPLSLPVLVAVSREQLPVATEEDTTGVTGVQAGAPSWSVETMSHLASNSCLVVEGFALAGGSSRLTIGRSRACDYRIADRSVSAIHAHLSCDLAAGEYFLSDAGSRNGTFVNGTRLAAVQREPVWPGSLLGFGATVFCFLDAPTIRKLASLAHE